MVSSCSYLSMTAAPTESPQTLTVVRQRSRNQSMARIVPMPWASKPTAARTMTPYVMVLVTTLCLVGLAMTLSGLTLEMTNYSARLAMIMYDFNWLEAIRS